SEGARRIERRLAPLVKPVKRRRERGCVVLHRKLGRTAKFADWHGIEAFFAALCCSAGPCDVLTKRSNERGYSPTLIREPMRLAECMSLRKPQPASVIQMTLRPRAQSIRSARKTPSSTSARMPSNTAVGGSAQDSGCNHTGSVATG